MRIAASVSQPARGAGSTSTTANDNRGLTSRKLLGYWHQAYLIVLLSSSFVVSNDSSFKDAVTITMVDNNSLQDAVTVTSKIHVYDIVFHGDVATLLDPPRDVAPPHTNPASMLWTFAVRIYVLLLCILTLMDAYGSGGDTV